MITIRRCVTILLPYFFCIVCQAQVNEIVTAKKEDRIALLWKYCTLQLVSDQQPDAVHQFFGKLIKAAGELNDDRLRRYAQFFDQCYQIPFSENFLRHFPKGGYKDAVLLMEKVKGWAEEHHYADISATCDHYLGSLYYTVSRYGLAFEYLLKADQGFSKIGYDKVANNADFLYVLGLRFYQFEEYDKSLAKLLEAARYRSYLPRTQINTLNAIGLIYARKDQPDSAITYFRATISKATQFADITWQGIGAGNLGNVYLSLKAYDSAILYHSRNFRINSDLAMKAPEDAAKSAVSLATAFLAKNETDSAWYYMNASKPLAFDWIKDSSERLDFKARLLRVTVQYYTVKNDLKTALAMSDSLASIEKRLRSVNDGMILSRAVEKTEALSFANNLALIRSEKNAAQYRFYFIITVLAVATLLLLFFYRNRQLRNKRMMQLAEKDRQLLLAEKKLAEEGLNHSRDLLNAYIDTVREKSALITQLQTELSDAKKSRPVIHLGDLAPAKEQLMTGTILTDRHWQEFRDLFEQVYPGFTLRLKTTYPELSPAESRFIYLAKLNLNSREMATMLGVTIEAIQKLRYRLRKKLHLEEASGFDEVLQKIA